jgi:hypothetical protein
MSAKPLMAPGRRWGVALDCALVHLRAFNRVECERVALQNLPPGVNFGILTRKNQ